MDFPDYRKFTRFFFTCWEALTGLFYPRICRVCGAVLVGNETGICSRCLSDLPLAGPDWSPMFLLTECLPLGCLFEEMLQPVRIEEQGALYGDNSQIVGEGSFVSSVSDNDKVSGVCIVKGGYSLFYYDKNSNYKNLIHAVKYASDRKLAFFLGKMLGERIKDICMADCIIPVPLHPRRERKRGFNQALIIAEGIASVLDIPVCANALVRVCDNVSQTGKSAMERRENVKDIFEFRNVLSPGFQHILLVDDVITTGATICSCLSAIHAGFEFGNRPCLDVSLASLGRTC